LKSGGHFDLLWREASSRKSLRRAAVWAQYQRLTLFLGQGFYAPESRRAQEEQEQATGADQGDARDALRQTVETSRQ